VARKRALLLQYLEGVSWKILEDYPQAVRELIRSRAGVYALYRRSGKLYYVGLASNLMGRINSHLRDRHHGVWDRFSVYLTQHHEHMKELESLLLRIVKPSGNSQGGRFARIQSIASSLNRRMKDIDADRRARLLGGHVARRRARAKAIRAKGPQALAGISERTIQLRATRGGRSRARGRPIAPASSRVRSAGCSPSSGHSSVAHGGVRDVPALGGRSAWSSRTLAKISGSDGRPLKRDENRKKIPFAKPTEKSINASPSAKMTLVA